VTRKKSRARARARQRATAAADPPPAPARPSPRFGAAPGLALAALSGVLWFLACTPFDLWGLAWIAMLPVLYAIECAPTPARAALCGWVAGAVATGGGFYWLIDLMRRFAGFPLAAAVLVFVAFCAYHGLIFMASAWLLRRLRGRFAWPLALLCPLVVVACERLLPEIFPWGLWITQAWHPLVLQIAEWTGPLGVTALLLLVNGALYDLLRRRRAALAPALAAAGVLGAVLAGGALRMQQVDALQARAPRLVVGLVQPNAPYPIDGPIPAALAAEMVAGLKSQTERLARAGAELVVWSEGSFPYALRRDFARDLAAGSPQALRPAGAPPLVVGTTTWAAALQDVYNSALLLDADGRVLGRYDKVRLLAFGEYVPAIETLPWLRALLPEGAGRFTAGSGPVTMPLPGPAGRDRRLAPIICYEDILPGYLRRVGALRPDLLVNLTSDGWFGAAAEPWQHLALSVFATIELRTALVRAVNSGVSALVDANGRVVARSYAIDPYRDPHPADGLLVTAPLLEGGHTVFAAVGQLFADLCVALVAVLLALALRAGRRARS